MGDQVNAVYNIGLYSPSGGFCQGEVAIDQILGTDYTRNDIANDLDFDEFSGDCDVTNIGGIDVLVPSRDGVDAIITQITGIGFPDPTPTATATSTPSRSPAPSDSRTPAPSPSNTPSRSVTPTPSRTPSLSALRSATVPFSPAIWFMT